MVGNGFSLRSVVLRSLRKKTGEKRAREARDGVLESPALVLTISVPFSVYSLQAKQEF